MTGRPEKFCERMARLDPGCSRIERIATLQVNVGNLCNMHCSHCHVEGSPAGSRLMGREVMAEVCDYLRRGPGTILDITGGCPEMHPDFRFLIEESRGLSPRRIVRSNLTILTEPGMEWLPGFLREEEIVVTASLPCYLEDNVDSLRGKGTYRRSVEGIRRLNGCGYGRDRELNLVYNPGGAFVPPPQSRLEEAYRDELFRRHGLVFSSLFAIANAPIGRFRSCLKEAGKLETYLELLRERFNDEAAALLMCRFLLSVDWQGRLFNCDFNQAEGVALTAADGKSLRLRDVSADTLVGSHIAFGDHCYGCTAGEGSSCTGALAA